MVDTGLQTAQNLLDCATDPGELADMADGEVLNERFNPALHAPGEAGARGNAIDMFTVQTSADGRRGEQAVVNQTCRSNRSAHAPGGYVVSGGSMAWVAGIGDKGNRSARGSRPNRV